jgi:hypothetical protein
MKKPGFYAIIPASVRYDSTLSSSEKIFYSEITAMSGKEGYCWASNSYFSELYGVKNPTISMWVKSLKEKKHIVVEYEKEGKQIKRRKIYPIQKIEIPYSENRKGGSQKIERGWSENRKENNTSINNTSMNNGKSAEASFIPSLEEVKNYFSTNGYSPKVAERAYNMYQASVEDHPKRKYWRDSRDNPIKNWKLKMQSVWFKDENKIQNSSIRTNAQAYKVVN